MRRIALCISAAVFGATAQPVFAQVSKEPLTVVGQRLVDEELVVRVPYWDLQLARPGDVGTLYQRVRAATARACEHMYGRSYVSQKWTCRTVAMEVAQPQIDRAIDAAQGVRTASADAVVLAFDRDG